MLFVPIGLLIFAKGFLFSESAKLTYLAAANFTIVLASKSSNSFYSIIKLIWLSDIAAIFSFNVYRYEYISLLFPLGLIYGLNVGVDISEFILFCFFWPKGDKGGLRSIVWLPMLLKSFSIFLF